MPETSDPRRTWWWWRDVQSRLTKWTLALLQGHHYTVELDPDCGTASHCFEDKSIRANPQFLRRDPVPAQFRITQALLAHEVGHAFYTDAWVDQKNNILAQLVNMLEDQRIENGITAYYPGIAPAIDLLGDRILQISSRVKLRGDPSMNVFRLCLLWRWAFKRIKSERSFLNIMGADKSTKELWEKVKPMVEESWRAARTQEVIEKARDILKLLNIPESQGQVALMGVSGKDIPRKRERQPEPLPKEASHEQVGLGEGLNEEKTHRYGACVSEDPITQPQPYTVLEDKASPLANQLTQSLKLPQPEVLVQPHEWLGRYSFRQESRTPETPNRVNLDIDYFSRNLALYLAVDRSGSMGYYEEDVRLAIMILYLAAIRLGIPTGISFFGDSSIDAHKNRVFEVTPPTQREEEGVKAVIAGYVGDTGCEYVDWALRLAEKELLARPERRKVMLVIHDGQPGYDGPDGNDWNLSFAHIRKLEQRGITVIGIYLGNDKRVLPKVKELFPRLVETNPHQLPVKLGAMLRALAG